MTLKIVAATVYLATLIIEWWLPRTTSVRARSILEGIFNVLHMTGPGTPPPPTPEVTAVAKDA